MNTVIRHGLRCALAFALAGPFAAAQAQSYPSKPIRMVIPYPPGGATDLMGRLFQNRLAQSLGQTVIVDNRGGATGMIGTRNVAQSAPDGYSILFTVGTDMAISRVLSKDAPVDPVTELSPIIAAVASISCIAAGSSAPVGSLAEMIAYAKANPGRLTYGTPGIGSSPHLNGEKLKLLGVDLLHVPFKGSGPSVTALVAGQIDLMIGNLATALANTRSGKVKVLAMTHGRRYEGMPEIPSIVEALPGGDMPQGWYGFFGPARLPRPIVARLNGEILRLLGDRDMKARIEEATFSVMGGTPEEFGELVRQSLDVYAKVVQATGVKGE